ncbi:MAG: hypothetical protein ACOCUI_04265, partial [bacterium]
MADIVTQTVNLSAENFNMTEFARVLSDVFKQTQNNEDFFDDTEEMTDENSDDKSYLIDSIDLLVSNGDILHNDLLNLNDTLQTVGDLLLDSILQLGEMSEKDTNRLIKSQKKDEDKSLNKKTKTNKDLFKDDEEEIDKDDETSKGVKSGLKSLLLGGLFASVVNLIRNAFKGYQEGGIKGLLKAVFKPDTIFSSMGNYAVMGATLGSFIPGIGTIVGGILGAVSGLVMGLFRAGHLDGLINWVSEFWDKTVVFIKEVFEDFMYSVKQIFTSLKIFFTDKIMRNIELGLVKYKQTMKKVYVDTPLDILKSMGLKIQEIFTNVKITLFESIKNIINSKLFKFLPGIDNMISSIDNKINESEEALNEIEKIRKDNEEKKLKRELDYSKEMEEVNEKYDKAIKSLEDSKKSLENKKIKEERLREKMKEEDREIMVQIVN